MSKISLRAYNREIESLIEQNQFDQAIAHARHILKFFPKHVHTYRLLGKAYLESQRYGDATDLFQRVLSAVPDDFVSHVGMSIIREDEGNLDEAIWHMERAFEVQPANSAIQKELRRLYGRRDGLEPPKVRLTRGALARMYLKGELYPQAIAELRAALVEDPQRPDLLTLLAQAYFAAGMRVEAAETCSTLLKKLPYSLEANRILAEILANSERADEADIYRQRVYALDPYTAYVSPSNPTPDKVPDSTIALEKLVWSPGQPIIEMPAQPDWAMSLGVNLDEAIPTQEESVPNWLNEPVITSASPQDVSEKVSPFESPRPEEEITPKLPEEEPIPDWMKEAGWQPASDTVEMPPEASIESEAPGEELVPGEIPEWLQAIAPKEPTALEEAAKGGVVEEHEEEPPSEIGELPPWLEETPPGATDSVAVWLTEKQPPLPGEPGIEFEGEESPEIPDWLKDLEPTEPLAPAEGLSTAILPEEGEPEWQAEAEIFSSEDKGTIETEESAVPSTPISEPSPSQTQTPPFTVESEIQSEEALAWLEGLAAKQGAEEALFTSPEERPETPPDWMLEASAKAQEEGLTPPSAEKGEVPEWLKEAFEAKDLPQATEPSLEAETEEIPDWLRSAMAGTTTPEEPLSSAVAGIPPLDLSEEPTEAIPEWLRAPEAPTEPELETRSPAIILPAESEILSEEALAEASPITEPAPEETETAKMELPPWLAEQEISTEEPEGETPLLSDTQPMRVRPAQEVMIQPSEIESPPPISEESEMPEAMIEGELPEWLKGLEEEQTLTTEQAAPSEALPMEAEEAIPTIMEDEAAFAWLEGLAARQGADEALLLKPEERLETPPEWVQKAVEEAEVTEAIQTPEQIAHAAEISETTPTVEPLPPSPGSESIVIEIAPETGEPTPELPEWLTEVERPQPAEEDSAWIPPMPPEAEALPPSPEAPIAGALGEKESARSLLNINEAGLSELERLPGVGFIRAQAIIAYRNEHGAFNQLDDLLNVPGFDAELVDSLKERITFGEPEVVEPQVEGVDMHQITLIQARNALIQGESALALSYYQTLIKEQQLLPEVIQDLNEALYRFPLDISLWEALGDACLRAGQLQDALDAYTKAEELLR